MSKTVTVGISDLNVVRAPDTLVTYALGSCVGICMYDPVTKVAGLSHIMLPSSSLTGSDPKQAMRFANTAIPMLLKKMESQGAQRSRIKAKIAGGAQMFASTGNSAISNIGQRNIAAVKQALAALHIPIIADDTGKNYGRTLYLTAADGVMRIKSVNRGEWTY